MRKNLLEQKLNEGIITDEEMDELLELQDLDPISNDLLDHFHTDRLISNLNEIHDSVYG